MSGILIAAAGRGQDQLTASCSPASVAGFYDPELDVGITDATTAIPHGGLGPYTYSWAKFSGVDFNILPSPTVVSPQFGFTGASHKVAVYRVTVTDDLGQNATADVNVTAN